MKYNPRLHITAAQLRQLNIFVSQDVPDEAFVLRSAVEPSHMENASDGLAISNAIHHFTADFEWYEVEFDPYEPPSWPKKK